MKGITPVIAIVLLLMITIAMVGFAFVWFQGMWSQTAETTSSQIQAQQQAMLKTIVIDNVNCPGADIYVRNTGSTTIPVDEVTVYVAGVKQTCTWVGGVTTIPQGTIATCDSGTVAIPSGAVVKVSSPGSVDETKC